MSATPLFESRVDWTSWAEHAERRKCAGCDAEFQPNHPRRRFCSDDCPGRRAQQQPRRRRATGRAQAAKRRAGVQGFVGEILVHAARTDQPSAAAVLRAARLYLEAERAGQPAAARAALTALCGEGAARAVELLPVTDTDCE